MGKVRGLKIEDNQEITAMDEVKFFYLDFESIGAGTCVVMDFQDGIKEAFGDDLFCAEWAPEVEYIPKVAMELPVVITHTYQYVMVLQVKKYNKKRFFPSLYFKFLSISKGTIIFFD